MKIFITNFHYNTMYVASMFKYQISSGNSRPARRDHPKVVATIFITRILIIFTW